MNAIRRFFERIRFTRAESMALMTVFGLYVVGLTWRYVQKTSVPFDDGYYARIDSAFGANAFVPVVDGGLFVADTLPKSDTTALADSALARLNSAEPAPQMSTGRLNVNLATERQLTKLPGIGPALARRIIVHPQEHGPFRSPDELVKVKGIGAKKLAKFRGMIVTD